MKLYKCFIALMLLTIPMVGYAQNQDEKENQSVSKNSAKKYRVVNDTIIIADTIVLKSGQTIQPVKSETVNDYQSTQGFFDRYIETYKGDLNENLKTVVKTVKPKNAEELEKKKQELQKTLSELEEKSLLEKERYEEMEKKRKAYNEELIKQGVTEEEEGKTLDTNLLIK